MTLLRRAGNFATRGQRGKKEARGYSLCYPRALGVPDETTPPNKQPEIVAGATPRVSFYLPMRPAYSWAAASATPINSSYPTLCVAASFSLTPLSTFSENAAHCCSLSR